MNKIYYILASVLVLATGCSQKEVESGADEFGQLRITCTPNDEVVVRAATVPAGDTFSLLLTDGVTPLSWPSIGAFAAENPLLRYGEYTASVTWGDPNSEGEDAPYYTGSKQFSLLPRQITEINITAKMVKAQVLIRTTEQFRTYFKDAHFIATTGSGNAFDYYFASTSEPVVPDSDQTICVCAQTSLSIRGAAYKQAPTGDGNRPQVIFPEQVIEATKASTRHIFEFDAADAGSATLRILLDDTLIETVAIEVELNDDAIIN